MQSRLLPFTVAGVICFAAAFALGASVWYFFGTKPLRFNDNSKTIVQISNQNSNVNSNENAPTPTPTPEPKKAPAGEVAVTGGEVTLGGGETKLPLRRVAVSAFSIGETEVTNEDYAVFINAAGHKAPAHWKEGKFAPGTGKEPVAGVSWTDAAAYCEWLSKELDATVRLPSEAEWILAARGANTENQYPWGAEWANDAASSAETNGKILPVRSFPAGRSPSGAFEMIGNVWEWTNDVAEDEFGKPILFGKSQQRIIKGGSAKEERKYLSVLTRVARPEDRSSDTLGFRYVIIRK